MALQLVTAPSSLFIPEPQPTLTLSTIWKCRSVSLKDSQPPITGHGLSGGFLVQADYDCSPRNHPHDHINRRIGITTYCIRNLGRVTGFLGAGLPKFEAAHPVATDPLLAAVHTTLSAVLVARPPMNVGASSLRWCWTRPWRATSLQSGAVCQ